MQYLMGITSSLIGVEPAKRKELLMQTLFEKLPQGQFLSALNIF